MADSKTANKSKSKSNNMKSIKLSSQSQQLPAKSSTTVGSTNHEQLRKSRSSMPGSILEKLDLDYLKETTLKNMKSGIQSSFPIAREACIEYALDMVVGNLILNGHLDPKKAQKMRNPVMKSQIAAICDDMISAKTEISKASIAMYCPSRKKSKPSSKHKNRPRSRPKTQKFAIQPAALPITIVTNQSLSKLPKFTMMEKINLSMKEAGSVKSARNVSTDDFKKPKSRSKLRTKSLESASEIGKDGTQAQQLPPPPGQTERRDNSRQHASSEVPSSNHSLENNLKQLSSNPNNALETSSTKLKQQATQEQASDGLKQVEDGNKNVTISTSDVEKKRNAEENKIKEEVKARKEEMSVQSPPQAPTDAARSQLFSPVPVQSCSSAIFSPRTLSTFINNSNCSVPSTASTGYQVLVDLKGFQNDEISMEVEGRQLIFLASRPKREELNVRKVTEIVDVPGKVNMENLKIGRRTDGYVIIEEHDA